MCGEEDGIGLDHAITHTDTDTKCARVASVTVDSQYVCVCNKPTKQFRSSMRPMVLSNWAELNIQQQSCVIEITLCRSRQFAR